VEHQFASQSTDSFRQLLHQAQASLLISTYQAGQLVLVRPQGESVNTHFMGFGRPMGMAWKPGELAVGDASRIVTYRNLPAVAKRLDDAGPVDACYLPRQVHTTGAIDIHEMAFDADGELWFVNTRMSCLATRSREFSFVPRWRPPFITAYDLTDRCHLNGLGLRDGRPRYVSMLGATDEPGGWRRNKISGGLIMDITTHEVLADQLCMPHSPRWYRDQLWFLSSGAAQLMRLASDGTPEVVAEVPGFARGMDFIDRYALIGLSQVRESAVFAGLPLTQRISERKSGVWVVDLETGQTVAFLEFMGSVQEVFEVRVLPHRFPLMLEENSPLVATSYELPDEVLNNLAPADPVQEALDEARRHHLAGRLGPAIEVSTTLIGDNSGSGLVEAPLGGPDADGNLIGDPNGNGIIDPLLGPLADNGGLTLTHLPQPGSPAIDAAGDCTGTDQRGATRPQEDACDMGAVEVLGDLIFRDSFEAGSVSTSFLKRSAVVDARSPALARLPDDGSPRLVLRADEAVADGLPLTLVYARQLAGQTELRIARHERGTLTVGAWTPVTEPTVALRW
jgi:uncharacterized protein (TIGR03032 family)